jgi:hypothetical protein
VGFVEPCTIASNLCAHSLQTYSKIGIHKSIAASRFGSAGSQPTLLIAVRVPIGQQAFLRVLGGLGALSLTVSCVACGRPDLVIDSGPPKVDLAQTGVPGGSLRLGPWTVRNRGNGSTASYGRYATGYFLSTDPVITNEDRRLRGQEQPEAGDLAPGQGHTFPGDARIEIPNDVTPGTYYFGVLVDVDNQIPESDDTNNYASVRIGVVPADK